MLTTLTLATDAPSQEAAGLMDRLRDLDTTTVVEMATPAVGALLLLFFGWIVAGWIGRLVTRGLNQAHLELTLSRFAGKLARWTILVFVALGILGLFGVEVTAFAAVIAAVGFSVGMALQGTLGNFAAGVMLLVFRPFKVGDFIKAGGHAGTVFEIDLFVTTLDTPDNRRLIVPNGAIFGSSIENVSHHATRRVDVAVGTDYGADIDRTREILLGVARGLDNVLSDPEPAVVLADLGASSIDWSVRVWVNAGDFWPVKDALTRSVKYALDEAGISIPFPQMDVHLPAGAASA
jgi:small conductance mechanosensitive channel